ncbi:hypothetical protein EG329_000324 [Mollisiaceae sp. DMI_Dod_QoI]|nr:hypothetical protein EG329_000324 [Helotiales sp. DMI_Dod_QoI]
MSTKPKRSNRAAKPDCKVWIQVGEELLTEYLNKPLDGVEGCECYIVVALGDVLTLHCQAKPGIVDEFVLIPDGVIRACESRRNLTLVLDKALHRAEGRGKQAGAVFRSDMVIQIRNEKESRLVAQVGQEPSNVGTIVVEGWRKKKDGDEKDTSETTVTFPTYEEQREWYDGNRFINPAPGHLPPFEVGFMHAKNSCPNGSGPRERVKKAGARKTSEWELSYKFIFYLRSATELHKLGQIDVPVRNPASDLFAEEVAKEATDIEDEAADPETEDAPEDPEDKSMDRNDQDADGVTTKKKSKSQTTVIPHQTVSGLLDLMAKSASEVLVNEEAAQLHKTISEEQALAIFTSTAVGGHAGDSVHVSGKSTSTIQPDKPVKLLGEHGEEVIPKPKNDANTPGSTHATLRKRSLPGVKSAPANRASRDRVSTQGNDTVASNLSSDQVLSSTETADEPDELVTKHPEQIKSAEIPSPIFEPITPPQTARKIGQDMKFTGVPETLDRRASLPVSSSLCTGPEMSRKLSEPRTYVTSSIDFTITHLEGGSPPELSVDAGLQDRLISGASNNPQNNHGSQRPEFARALSEVSNASTEVADPADVQMSVKSSQKLKSSTSNQNSLLSQASVGQNSFAQSDSMTPEPRNHTVPSPILGTLSSFTIPTEGENHADNTAKEVRQQWRERETTPHQSPSSQLLQEAASSFNAISAEPIVTARQVSEAKDLSVTIPELRAPPQEEAALSSNATLTELSTAMAKQSSELRRQSVAFPELLGHRQRKAVLSPSAAPTELSATATSQVAEVRRPRDALLKSAAVGRNVGDRSLFATQGIRSRRQSLTVQPETLTRKRKANDTAGNGPITESDRPRKSSIAPAKRSLADTMRQQQEENQRLEKELKDLRIHNSTLENIRELKRHRQSVQQHIDAEKARQAALEAELEQ